MGEEVGILESIKIFFGAIALMGLFFIWVLINAYFNDFVKCLNKKFNKKVRKQM